MMFLATALLVGFHFSLLVLGCSPVEVERVLLCWTMREVCEFLGCSPPCAFEMSISPIEVETRREEEVQFLHFLLF